MNWINLILRNIPTCLRTRRWSWFMIWCARHAPQGRKSVIFFLLVILENKIEWLIPSIQRKFQGLGEHHRPSPYAISFSECPKLCFMSRPDFNADGNCLYRVESPPRPLGYISEHGPSLHSQGKKLLGKIQIGNRKCRCDGCKPERGEEVDWLIDWLKSYWLAKIQLCSTPIYPALWETLKCQVPKGTEWDGRLVNGWQRNVGILKGPRW